MKFAAWTNSFSNEWMLVSWLNEWKILNGQTPINYHKRILNNLYTFFNTRQMVYAKLFCKTLCKQRRSIFLQSWLVIVAPCWGTFNGASTESIQSCESVFGEVRHVSPDFHTRAYSTSNNVGTVYRHRKSVWTIFISSTDVKLAHLVITF